MNESSKNTPIDLTNLGLLLKEKMKLVKHETTIINSLKEEIREIMVENDTKEFENEEFGLSIKCQRSFSFDVGMFKYEEPKISQLWITEETITKTRDVLDKKKLQSALPETYKKYLVENTPRLTVK